MEENTFLDVNPQFAGLNPNATHLDDRGNVRNDNSLFTGTDDNAISRWWNPEIAEQAQFNREDYFVNKENAFNEYMWNKTNEYNSAEAQMKRAKAAGINPNLMAAGIAGAGGNQAIPMQGARGDTAMNGNTVNPIEQIKGLADTLQGGVGMANQLGELFGFGEKNTAEIKLIRQNAEKAGEEMNYTKTQRKQLEGIGGILIDNAKKEGKKIDTDIEQLKELINVYKYQEENIKADTDLKEAQTGTELEKRKSQEYENAKLEFEKAFREIFGIELTHSQMAMLVEACLNGKGDKIVNYLTDTIASVIRGSKDAFKRHIKDKLPKWEKPIETNIGGLPHKIKNIEKTEWSKKIIKDAKKEWEIKKRKRPNLKFEDYLKSYLSRRGLTLNDLQ